MVEHGDQALLQGAAFYQLVDGCGTVALVKRRDIHDCAYTIEAGASTVGLLLKHSTRPRSWPFTLSEAELRAIRALSSEVSDRRMFIGLVCGRDGVCCLSARELFSLIPAGSDGGNHQMRVRRPRGGRYRVTGPAGAELPYRIPVKAWPQRLFGGNE